jgi:predicted nucleotidyltransferase
VAAEATAPTVDDARRAAFHVAGDPRVEEVLVFGSVARGQSDPHSDIDLLVVLSDIASEEWSAGSVKLNGRLESLEWPCELVVRPRHLWDHLVSNVSASFEAAVAAEAKVLYRRSSRASGGPPVSLAAVATDNLDIASRRLLAATGELGNIRDKLLAVTADESRSADLAARGLSSEQAERRQRYLSLLGFSHMAIELSVKCLVAAGGGEASRSHNIDRLLEQVADPSARAAMDTAVEPLREDFGLRTWRVGVYEMDDRDWQDQTNAANAAAHIVAAASAVQIAAEYVRERWARPEHRALAERAEVEVRRLQSSGVTASSLSTGVGLTL